jgi:hypothetical protein
VGPVESWCFVYYLSPSWTGLLTFTFRYRQLFGEDEDASGELDEAEKQGENGMSFFTRHSFRSVIELNIS